MRIWTVNFSFAVALAAQLDAFRLLSQLWLDPQARESLVNSSGAMLREAGAIMQTTTGGQITPVPSSDPQVYVAAFDQLKADYPAETSGLPEMPPQASYADAKGWLAEHLAGRPDAEASSRSTARWPQLP
jgi:hypothetical protein